MRGNVKESPDYCAIEVAMEVLGGRWKLAILKQLLAGTQRFGQLQRAMPSITQRMLTRQLRELEVDGLVARRVYQQVPPKVEYSLTPVGSSLKKIADLLDEWGHWYQRVTQQHLKHVGDRDKDDA
jgi:DNA-binding HxlR family transcriptional regulator